MGQTRRGKGKESYSLPLQRTDKVHKMKGKCLNYNGETAACGFCIGPMEQGERGKRPIKRCYRTEAEPVPPTPG